MSFAQLKACDPESFRTSAKAYRDLADALDERADEIAPQLTDFDDAWDGQGSPAADKAIRDQAVVITDTVLMLQRADQILSDFAGELDKAKAMLTDAMEAATRISATVAENGSVTPKSAKDQTAAEEIVEQFRAAIQYADTADTTASTDLAALTPPVPGQQAPVDLSTVPAIGTDPERVKEWWNSLTPEEQQYLIAQHPDRIGWLDGVPATARDQANRLVLDRELDTVNERMSTLEDQGQTDTDEYRELQGKKRGLEAIEDRLELSGGDGRDEDGLQSNEQRAYLLGVSTEGDGQAIVAIGNPDTADNIVTFVPGTSAELAGVRGDIGRVDRMVYDANNLDPTQRTAGIMWLGYDAPDQILEWNGMDDLTNLGRYGDASDPGYAQRAGTALDRFSDGLRVTHEGERSHNSIVGHSYGSTVIGYTAKDHGLDVDEAIFVGSPGVGTDTAAELGLNPENVYSSHASNDPIRYLTETEVAFGNNPSDEDFGGRRFASDPGTPLFETHTGQKTYDPMGPFGPSITLPTIDFEWKGGAHSDYWTDDNQSRDNIARIVTGTGGDITGDHP
ncbi:alpha/beta hydrolase [Stackebrandtia soli]|uniref:alpha/beta hydrolase n=1 Tax=Stackebrandtia soli TaxID=1892856 RepID=UPI0039EAE183